MTQLQTQKDCLEALNVDNVSTKTITTYLSTKVAAKKQSKRSRSLKNKIV